MKAAAEVLQRVNNRSTASQQTVEILHAIHAGLTVLSSKAADTSSVMIETAQPDSMLLQTSPTPLAGVSFSALAPNALAPNLDSALAPNLVEPELRPRIHAEVGHYRLRLAETKEDREAVCRLRFKVFNIELGEGLESSYETGLDTDEFDACCEHLLVEDKATRRIVGTYRMQSGETAAAHCGYYSEREFSFKPYEALRSGILELGRASIDREHRTPEVLTLLWRGIAQYATDKGLRYLIGCSSLNSTDPQDGWAMYGQLGTYRCAPEFETETTPEFACPREQQGQPAQTAPPEESQRLTNEPENAAKVPKLLRTYVTIGARIAAPPAWDREFGTIDFLTLLDLRQISPSARNRFLAPLTQ
jgi:putative hemolysin